MGVPSGLLLDEECLQILEGLLLEEFEVYFGFVLGEGEMDLCLHGDEIQIILISEMISG